MAELAIDILRACKRILRNSVHAKCATVCTQNAHTALPMVSSCWRCFQGPAHHSVWLTRCMECLEGPARDFVCFLRCIECWQGDSH